MTATEHPESVALRHPGATQSPDGSPRAAEGLRGAESAVTDAEAARWGALADAVTEGSWTASGRTVLGDGYGAEYGVMSFLPAIQGYGDLQLVEVFVAYDGPRVLSAQSATGQFFLAGWAAEGPEYDDWMFVPISSARLVMVRSGRITLRDAFIHPESMVYHVQLGHSPESDELVRLISGEDLPESWLPEALAARDAEAMASDAAVTIPRLLAERAALMGDADRLEREVARLHELAGALRGTAATLEAENARLTEALYLTRITLEATFRVLQEASGLPDDIDDPDCRDEMVLALRPRAEKAEAEVARLREGIEALSDEMQSDTCPACHAFYADEGSTTWGCDHTEGMQHAGDMLRALLAEGGE